MDTEDICQTYLTFQRNDIKVIIENVAVVIQVFLGAQIPQKLLNENLGDHEQ